MRLWFVLGKNQELAKKEIEAAATILPFQWIASMLHPGILELKSTAPLEWETDRLAGFCSPKAAQFQQDIVQLQDRLGGTIKIVWMLDEVASNKIHTWLAPQLTAASKGRWTLGVSFLQGKGPAEKYGLETKRLLKEQGLGMRYVPLKDATGSSASLWHNHLLLAPFDPEKPGIELNIANGHQGYLLGFTLTAQNITAYTQRDFGIPEADAVSGMLPPKLAQTMLNLALAGKKPEEVLVYDPFCGNGRVLVEYAEMGGKAFGSDLMAEKVAASQRNLEWMFQNEAAAIRPEDLVWTMDATSPEAPTTFLTKKGKDIRPFVIVAEPYLGRPLRGPLRAHEIDDWVKPLERLYMDFLATWMKQARADKPRSIILIFPEAKVQQGRPISLFANLFDRLGKLGYSAERLSHYARPDAVVGRDIVLLKAHSL